MDQLLKLVAQHLGREWIDISDWLRSLPENELAALEARIAVGNWAGITGIDDAALRFSAETQSQYVRAGEATARWLDGKVDSRLIRFDTDHSRVVERARQNKLENVYGFRDEQNKIAQQITHRAIVEGSQTGINPRRVAQDFRNSIGLAPIQEEWVANYQRDLEEGRFGAVMRRELHDARSDRMLRRLGRDDERLTQPQIDKLVEGYRRRMVSYRAETIARTTSSENVHEGLRDSFRQAIERGDIEVEQLTKMWHSRAPGPRAREQHQEMDNVEVPFGEDFELPDGTRMAHPGDPRGGAKHNASCGCTVSHALAA